MGTVCYNTCPFTNVCSRLAYFTNVLKHHGYLISIQNDEWNHKKVE